MNIEKATYGTVIAFGTRSDFNAKLQQMKKSFEDEVNLTDENGVSLLEKCLIARKIDLAKEFLENNASVNILTKEGHNELHLIAPHIRFDGAMDITNTAGLTLRCFINENGADELKKSWRIKYETEYEHGWLHCFPKYPGR